MKNQLSGDKGNTVFLITKSFLHSFSTKYFE
jgi:hypothetical protein